MNKVDNHFLEKRCEICGKLMVRVNWNLYAYKKKLNDSPTYSYFCSYSCYRKAGGDSGIESHYVRSKFKNRKRK